MKLKVVFLHPDLGIGGAERLVVDAAVAMKEFGHSVQIITNHHSTSHCFEETKDGTLPVIVVGDWLPRTVLDVVFVDQISACIPVLKCMPCKVIFYCHYPDQLLAAHDNILKRYYRLPLDWLEEKTTMCADMILVNSYFTLNVFKNTFKSIKKQPEVVYPSINTAFFDNTETTNLEDIICMDNCKFLLSVNRFERKKNLELAIHSLSLLSDDNIKLILAGGYDPLNLENIEYFQELLNLVKDLNLNNRIIFLKSPSDGIKISLLRHCLCLIYTPSNEHFGIVPLEAMYCCKPIVAVNNGGPKETIENGINGYLRIAEPKEFADAIEQLMKVEENVELFGLNGKKRFDNMFSFGAFKNKINNVLEKVCLTDRL
ncbi:Glycosyl transferase, family 1,Glycosyltransferase subfamily 4-like, N-terminal domain [Cinara cedri]|uniref:Alpha-1,3/1,6-mannosyltransferase ALG2 n=1 Tax=Cinara cedri TaxID=506608 RepID=A0A5E4N2G4_9HEMI|nr:Glycosyl transferase, family 1,Glycosyltransferase subfamily 4-like, N-terminal domain [Cinara cedri]